MPPTLKFGVRQTKMGTIPKSAGALITYALMRLSLKHPVRAILCTIAVYIGIIIPIVGVYYADKAQKEWSALRDAPLQEKLTRLEEMQIQLKAFQNYIAEQERKLRDTDTILQSLQDQKGSLEKAVAADRTALQALLDEHARKTALSLWKERCIAFFLGVLSSLCATIILWIVGIQQETQS